MKTNRERLTAMFASLRRQGYAARQNFLCCGSCAAAVLCDAVRAKQLRGAVFYHRREGERLAQGAERVYLSYGAGEGATDEQDLAVALDVLSAAYNQGLAVKWDGKTGTCVQVQLPGGLEGVQR